MTSSTRHGTRNTGQGPCMASSRGHKSIPARSGWGGHRMLGGLEERHFRLPSAPQLSLVSLGWCCATLVVSRSQKWPQESPGSRRARWHTVAHAPHLAVTGLLVSPRGSRQGLLLFRGGSSATGYGPWGRHETLLRRRGQGNSLVPTLQWFLYGVPLEGLLSKSKDTLMSPKRKVPASAEKRPGVGKGSGGYLFT